MLAGGGAICGFNGHQQGWYSVQQVQENHLSGEISAGDLYQAMLDSMRLPAFQCRAPYLIPSSSEFEIELISQYVILLVCGATVLPV